MTNNTAGQQCFLLLITTRGANYSAPEVIHFNYFCKGSTTTAHSLSCIYIAPVKGLLASLCMTQYVMKYISPFSSSFLSRPLLTHFKLCGSIRIVKVAPGVCSVARRCSATTMPLCDFYVADKTTRRSKDTIFLYGPVIRTASNGNHAIRRILLYITHGGLAVVC